MHWYTTWPSEVELLVSSYCRCLSDKYLFILIKLTINFQYKGLWGWFLCLWTFNAFLVETCFPQSWHENPPVSICFDSMCILTHAFTLEVQTQSEQLKDPSPNLSNFEITKASIPCIFFIWVLKLPPLRIDLPQIVQLRHLSKVICRPKIQPYSLFFES